MFLKSNTTLVIANNAFVIPLHRQSRVASLFVFDHKYPGHALNSDSVVLSSGVQVPDVALNCFALHPVTLISIFKLIALRLLSSLLLQSIEAVFRSSSSFNSTFYALIYLCISRLEMCPILNALPPSSQENSTRYL